MWEKNNNNVFCFVWVYEQATKTFVWTFLCVDLVLERLQLFCFRFFLLLFFFIGKAQTRGTNTERWFADVCQSPFHRVKLTKADPIFVVKPHTQNHNTSVCLIISFTAQERQIWRKKERKKKKEKKKEKATAIKMRPPVWHANSLQH